MNQNETVTKPPTTTDKSIVEFVPFGTDDKIKLSVEIVKRLVAVKTKQGKVCSDEEAFKFILMCRARKLNPFEGDAFLIGYDTQDGPKFSLITAHQAFLKRAEIHHEFDGMDSGVIVLREGQMLDLVGDFHVPTDKILGGWATVHFKNRKYPMRKRLRVDRFNKGFGVWKDDAAGMIVKCAEADALRSSFPTMLGGLYTEDENIVRTDILRPVFPDEPATPEAPTAVAVTAPAATPAPSGSPAPKPEPPPPPASQPPKKKSNGDTEPSSPTTRRLKAKAKPPSTEKRLPNHEKLSSKLAVGGFAPTDLIGLAVDNGWIDMSEASFEKLSEEKCAEFLETDNWELIMTLLDEKRAAAPSK
jgi:phage recombination protein Bet